jgi:hypothetical protein
MFIFVNSQRVKRRHAENGVKGAMTTNIDYMTNYTQNKDHNSY